MTRALTLFEKYEINERVVTGLVDQVRCESAMFDCVHHATQALESSLLSCDLQRVATIAAHLLIRAAYPQPSKGVSP